MSASNVRRADGDAHDLYFSSWSAAWLSLSSTPLSSCSSSQAKYRASAAPSRICDCLNPVIAESARVPADSKHKRPLTFDLRRVLDRLHICDRRPRNDDVILHDATVNLTSATKPAMNGLHGYTCGHVLFLSPRQWPSWSCRPILLAVCAIVRERRDEV